MTLVDFILKKFKDETSFDLSGDSQAMYRIKEAAEKALIELNEQPSTIINLPFITADTSGPLHLNLTIDQDWNKSNLPDTDELIFQKHRIHKPKSKNQSLVFIILAILIVAFSGILIFLLM